MGVIWPCWKGADNGRKDGVLDLKFAMLLARGKGSIHGLDSSDKMIAAARALCKDQTRASFEGKA